MNKQEAIKQAKEILEKAGLDFIIVTNDGEKSSLVVNGTQLSIAVALYTAIESNKMMTEVINSVSLELTKIKNE